MNIKGNAGPPELCPCTHAANSPGDSCGGDEKAEKNGAASHPLFAADSNAVNYGGAVVYDPGLVHRGLAHMGSAASGSHPRLTLHLILAPEGSLIRARPEMLLGGTARTHVNKWRKFNLHGSSSAGESNAEVGARCSDYESCDACTANGPNKLGGAAAKPWRTGCAWCIQEGVCVPDLTASCRWGANDHVGGAGLARGCPSAEAVAAAKRGRSNGDL